MKKRWICIPIALGLLVLASLRTEKKVETSEENRPSFEQQLGVQKKRSLMDVTLYFRFADTNVLGACSAQLDMRREETVASSIVRCLINGPDVAHDRLRGLFPQGTEVINVDSEGDTVFVTLTKAFLGRPDGAPLDWEDSTYWQQEAALRRQMAFQSLVLSLTEDGRFQRVQLYLADNDDDLPERIPVYYFDLQEKNPNVLLAACARDEEIMLTPRRMMKMVFDCWQEKNWEGIYPLLQRNELLTLSVFEAQMRDMDITLLEYSVTPGTVSLDGQSATVVVDAVIRSELGGDARIQRESVQLIREADNWAISLDELMDLMIRD